MARMYSRKKGKHGSHRPVQKIAPWIRYKPEEIEDIIVKLAKQGMGSAKIGLVLRDSYGMPGTKLHKFQITSIMKKHSLMPALPEDMFQLIKKAVNLSTHMSRQKKDFTSKRGLELTESKIRKLARYYIKRKMLPPDWKYDITTAVLIVKQEKMQSG